MKELSYTTFILIFVILLSGCGGDEVEVRGKIPKPKKQKIQRPEEIKTPQYNYRGARYRSPFSPSYSGTGGVSSGGMDQKSMVSPESLKVTGFFSDSQGKYAILSGAGQFFFVRRGRVYNEDEEELPGIAAVVKSNKIILITDQNTMHELPLPE
ncbi:MAG: hypothetical protein ACOC5R_01660 [Elusimicrobiota bacterium]